MAVDVSVVVPFFNPGADIDDCLASMLAQTLPRERLEVILVDDGSTDGSAALVDGWVDRFPDVLRVLHLPASGGPAHPRNVGIATAGGRYIQFVDSDDSLAPGALARLLEVADTSDADIVIGKISSDFRGVYQPLFRRTVTGRTVADYPLMNNLTVCKMFRRDFLLAHDIRLPEGPTYIEDQHLCVRAYAHARSVAVVADTVCYLYRRRRGAGTSHGETAIDPARYFAELGGIMDIIDGADFPAEARAGAYGRYYRTEMLGRLRGGAMLGYDAGYRADMIAAVRSLVEARLPVELDAELPVLPRVQARLLRDNDGDGLVELARRLRAIALHATATAGWSSDGTLRLAVAAGLELDGEPFRLQPDGDGWLLPQVLVPTVAAGTRRLGPPDDAAADLDLATISRADGTVWSTTDGLRLRIAPDGAVRIEGDVGIDPSTVAGGRQLAPGGWDLQLRVRFAGLAWTSRVHSAVAVPPEPAGWLPPDSDLAAVATAYWSGETPTLSLDVGQWARAVQDLLDDAPHVTVGKARALVIDMPQLLGTGPHVAVEISLEPVAAAAATVVRCDARLHPGPAGATIVAEVPSLPADADRWAVWLRVGPPGTAAPRRLAVELRETRLHRLALVEA